MTHSCAAHTTGETAIAPAPSWAPAAVADGTPWTRERRLAALETLLQQRILVIDGAMGTMI
ncbi:MAG: hypothetical protein ACJ8AU_11300, partial [Gemmatimonadales bacterium]